MAYWCGEFANAFVMSKMKLLTKGKHLWTRTIGSTVVGQFGDTVVVIFVIFVGVYDLGTMLNLIFTGYFAKVIYEATATPLTYLVVNTLKRAEGVDVFDEGVNFNPFQARVVSTGKVSEVTFCRLTCISHYPTVEARHMAAMTSLRLLAVLNVLFKYTCARQAARASS